MPRYLFQCGNEECGKCESRVRPMTGPEHDAPAFCPDCQTPMHRILTMPQLTTQPFLLCDDNKFADGFSETERTETRKFWDKKHTENYA